MTSAEPDRPFLLWGMMGAGKSAVAREIDACGLLRVADLDALLESRFGQTIGAFIAENGLSAFRRSERALLWEILPSFDVIALGGGALLDEALRQEVRSKATVCTLIAEPSVLVQRVQSDVHTRPILNGLDGNLEKNIRHILSARRIAYLDVDFVMDTTSTLISEIATSILALYEEREAA